MVGAQDPEITIGDVRILDFEFRNLQTIVGYLPEPPPAVPVVMEHYRQVAVSSSPCAPTE